MRKKTHLDGINPLTEGEKQMIVDRFIAQDYAGLWNELTQKQRDEINWLALCCVDELEEHLIDDMCMKLSEKWNSTIHKDIGRQ